MPTPRPAQRKMSPHLQNATFVLWVLFLFWTLLALVVMPLQIGGHEVKTWVGDPTRSGLAKTCAFLLQQFDFIWIGLAALSTYFATITTEGLPIARRWASTLFVAVAALLLLSTITGIPFGPMVFTGRLGPKLAGRLPFGAPLLWMTLLLGIRVTLLWLLPQARRWQTETAWPWKLALASGGLTALTALNVDLAARDSRFYWLWLQNPNTLETPSLPLWVTVLAWGVVGGGLSLLLRGGTSERPSLRPVIVFGAINTLFLLVNLLALRS